MNHQTRIPFDNQKLIYVLIHCHKLSTNDVEIICEGLQEILCISASVSGSPRIPGFGLGVLNEVFEELLPMTQVKGCIDQILQKLQVLKIFMTCDGAEDIDELLLSTLSLIVEKISEFSPNKSRKIKIILFTGENAKDIAKNVSACAPQNFLFHISNIKIIQFTDELTSKALTNLIDPDLFSEESTGIQIMSEVMQANPYAVKMLFKEWLIEEAGDIPHLKLNFREDINQTCLYFDMRESAIDLCLLPSAFGTKLNVTLTGSRVTSTTTGKSVSMVNLECTSLINFSSLSANWLCSTMIYLIPSSAEKFSFQEFWDNSQRVNALKARLKMYKEAMLCQFKSSQEAGFPNTSFVIFTFSQAMAIAQILPPELTLMESPFQDAKYDIPKKYKDQVEEMMKDMTTSDFKVDLLTSKIVPAITNYICKRPKGLVKAMPMDGIQRGRQPIKNAPIRPKSKEAVHPCLMNI